MILTPEIEQQIAAAITAAPDVALVLPDHAYGSDGRVLILVEGLPMDLHRHLHEILIRPLGHHERMHDASGVTGNVNPYLFTVIEGHKSPRTHCSKNHPYKGNEAPPNSRGYRCRICFRESEARRVPPRGIPNSAKTICPQSHPYTEENTIIDSAGRRRCRICTTKTKRDWISRKRASRKETS